MNTKIRVLKTSYVGLVLSLVSADVFAQSTETSSSPIEKIQITAQKRVTSLQETPLSITALTDEMLRAEGANTLEDIAAFTPGLVVGGNATFEFPVAIRGVSGAAAGIGADAPTAIYVDGVYLGRPSAAVFQMVDLERIEVLRGPQGTLYGRNTVGGAINLTSKKTSDEFEFYGTLGVTDLNEYKVQGGISGPLSDTVAYRLSGAYTDRDDWIEGLDGNGVSGSSTNTLRGAISYNPNDSVELVFRGDYTDIEDPLIAKTIAVTNIDPVSQLPVVTPTISASDFDKTTQSEAVFQDREMWGVSIQADVDIGDLTFTSITAYREGESAAQFDADGTANRILRSGQGGPGETQDQFSQEIRLTSPNFERLEWIIGAYFFEESSSYQLDVELLEAGVNLGRHSTNETSNWAAFGQFDFHVTDDLTFTAGLRYSDEEKQFAILGPVATPGAFDPANLSDFLSYFPPTVPLNKLPKAEWTSWTPKVGLSWNAGEDTMIYGSYSEGFKSGGHNILSGEGSFDPEEVSSWELGMKTDFAEGLIRVNTSVFYYDYENLQVRIPGPPGTTFIQNAATANIYGGEIEFQAVPTENLQISGGISLLHAEYDEYIQGEGIPLSNAGCSGGEFDSSTGTCDLGGNRLNRAPRYAYNLVGSYDFPLANSGLLTARLSYQYEDAVFFTEQNKSTEGHGGWESLNARLTYRLPGDNVQVAIFGRNLTDDRHYTHVLPIGANTIATGANLSRIFGAEISFQY